mmetsp:Transcript_33079/g.86901  ORF Transcript_33079/g.86901 Transcript_33079/m.86901 type:complete len:234 (+) Transcript_33079:521-1222(+)
MAQQLYRLLQPQILLPLHPVHGDAHAVHAGHHDADVRPRRHVYGRGHDRLHDGVSRDAHVPGAMLTVRGSGLLLHLPHLSTRQQLHDDRVPREAWLQSAQGPHQPLRRRLLGQHYLGAGQQPALLVAACALELRGRRPVLQAQSRLVSCGQSTMSWSARRGQHPEDATQHGRIAQLAAQPDQPPRRTRSLGSCSLSACNMNERAAAGAWRTSERFACADSKLVCTLRVQRLQS